MAFDKICMMGLGYIGLPTAAIIASRGIDVIGVDISSRVVDTINRGEIHIVEPALDGIVYKAVTSGKLKATTKAETADAFIIAVPTPLTADKRSDLSAVMAAADAIAPVLQVGNLVILESTSPVGATEALVDRLRAARPDLRFPHSSKGSGDIFVAYCPERVLPGRVVEELVSNDRAIGGISPVCTERAAELYGLFVRGELVRTTSRAAELCKLAENAFRDVNIAFANEMANVCDGLGINVWEVIALANRHPRVNILKPGPGVGGHCIAIDPWFIAESAPDDTPLIQSARRVNDQRPHRIVAQVREMAEGLGKKPTIACLGLTFKADIDDLRESPAVEIVEEMASGAIGTILAVEPNIEELPARLKTLEIALVDFDTAMSEADIVVLLVDHKPFRDAAERISTARNLLDTRGILPAFPRALRPH